MPPAWKLLGWSSRAAAAAAAAVLASHSSANAEQVCALGGKICQGGSKEPMFLRQPVSFWLLFPSRWLHDSSKGTDCSQTLTDSRFI